MYDTVEWVEYRTEFLQVNPFCYSCPNRARVVDHWKAHKGSEDLFWNETNFIPLCKKCHDTVTSLYDRHNPPKTEEKLKWLAQQRMINDINLKVKVLQKKLKKQNYDGTP